MEKYLFLLLSYLGAKNPDFRRKLINYIVIKKIKIKIKKETMSI